MTSSLTLSDRYGSLTRRDVDDWIAIRRIEDLNLEFKSAPRFFEVPDERKVLAKAISGFANATGGLIVWGVRCAADADGVDAAHEIQVIQDPARFLSNLTSYAGAAVSPPFRGVVHRLLDDSSLAVTLVPEGDEGPYMADLGVGKYFTRSGSRTLAMAHYQVMDVLNRRRRPDLRVLGYTSSNGRSIVVRLSNVGRVSARAPYVALEPSGSWLPAPWGIDGNGRLNLPVILDSGLEYNRRHRFGGSLTVMVHPGTELDVCILEWRGGRDIVPPTEVKLGFAIAAENLPLIEGTLSIPIAPGSRVMS